MTSKHFKIHELVPKVLYDTYGEKAWRYVDVRLIETIDKLKEVFSDGTMTINNYYWGGNREWSGIRTPDSKYYSVGSQHSYGNALDIVWSEYTAEEVRQYILNNQEEFPHIRRLEKDVSWCHLDLANTGVKEIVLFSA